MVSFRKFIYKTIDTLFDYFLLLASFVALATALTLQFYPAEQGAFVPDLSVEIVILAGIFVYLLEKTVRYNSYKKHQKSLLNSMKVEVKLIEKNAKETTYWDNYSFNTGVYLGGIAPAINGRDTEVLKEKMVEMDSHIKEINGYLDMLRIRVASSYSRDMSMYEQGDHVAWDIFNRIKEIKTQMLHSLSKAKYEIKLIEENR